MIDASLMRAPFEFGDRLAVADHDRAIGHRRQLFEFRCRQQHREAGVAQLAHDLRDIGFRADVDAARRFVEQQELRIRSASQRASSTFCWLPPESSRIG